MLLLIMYGQKMRGDVKRGNQVIPFLFSLHLFLFLYLFNLFCEMTLDGYDQCDLEIIKVKVTMAKNVNSI